MILHHHLMMVAITIVLPGSKSKPPVVRRTPAQARSAKTVEAILEAAAELLAEVGFEGLSTNLVCRRAGVSPPALYRYFGDKHAVLAALGERLMAAQNEALFHWAEQTSLVEDPQGALQRLLEVTVAATEASPSGVWVLRALRASPALSKVRLASHAEVTTHLAAWIGSQAEAEPSDVEPRLRVAVELGYAAVEMCFDPSGVPRELILAEASSMIARAFESIFAEVR